MTLFMSLLSLSCDTKPSIQKSTANNDNTSSNYFSNLRIDTITVNAFLRDNHISESIKIQTNRFYRKRNYTCAWLTSDGAKQAVTIFYGQLKNYSYYFADSSVSNPNLDDLIDSLNIYKEKFLSQENNREQLELQLTTSFFKFAKLAYDGSANNLQNLEWFIPRQVRNYQILIDSLTSIKNGRKIHEPLNERYFQLKNKLMQCRIISRKQSLPIAPMFKKTLLLGSTDSTVISLKQYLLMTSDLKINDGTNVFTDSLQKALKNFQRRMGLIENGSLDSLTTVELNKPITFRIKQIMVNIERVRWLPINVEEDYLLINIPEFKLYVFKSGQPVWATNIVVGKSATQTSIFKSYISQIILNPYWGVPQSIANKEILPHLKQDSNYLKNNSMKVFSGNTLVYSDTINWHNYESHVPYTFKQKPGKNNALGKIKFLFPNNYDIYLHDTPAKNLFNGYARAFSHGCIRVSNPKKLAAYLLLDNSKWTSQEVNNVLETDIETSIKLTPSVPIYIVYFTTWVDNDGQLNFRNDVYDLDKKVCEEVFEENYN